MNWAIVVVGAIAAASAIGVVAARQALNAALLLIVTIISLSVIFLLLNAQFLFAVQIIVYAGAIMVLFVFIIALLNPRSERRPALDWRLVIGVATAVVSAVWMWHVAGSSAIMLRVPYATTTITAPRGFLLGLSTDPNSLVDTPQAVNAAGNIQTLGGQLFTTYLLPFEVTSLLLLVAAAGAVYLTSTRRSVS